MAATNPPIQITILTGFLGAGKTTVLLSLLPQLPAGYRLALLKNEFGDVAVDSQVAAAASVSGVQELLNGCICCNLVGQLGDALDELATAYGPERIVIETSGSAQPATLALEVNRVAQERAAAGNGPQYALDGVAIVIDVENWAGYEDTSYTAKLQARYTDLVILNKWEDAGERRLDDVLDRLGDIDVPVATVRSDRGKVDAGVLLGLGGSSGALAAMGADAAAPPTHEHGHDHGHAAEVEVLSVSLLAPANTTQTPALDLAALDKFLAAAPKDEVYRIKAVLTADEPPTGSDGKPAHGDHPPGDVCRYALNWAFGRWTFTLLGGVQAADAPQEPVARMTLVTARGEADGWKRRIERQSFVADKTQQAELVVERVS